MMVMSIMQIGGDPDDLIERMKEVEEIAGRIAPEVGGISSTVVRTEDGLMLVNLWKDEEGRHKMAEHPEIRAAIQRAGLPQPHATGYEVIRHTTVEQPAAV
jgi:hypothetical protein